MTNLCHLLMIWALALVCLMLVFGCDAKHAGEPAGTPAEPMIIDALPPADAEEATKLNEQIRDGASERGIRETGALQSWDQLRWMGGIAFGIGLVLMLGSYFVPFLSPVRSAAKFAVGFAVTMALLPWLGERFLHEYRQQLHIVMWCLATGAIALFAYRIWLWVQAWRDERQIQNRIDHITVQPMTDLRAVALAKHLGAMAAVKRINDPRIDRAFRKDKLNAGDLA